MDDVSTKIQYLNQTGGERLSSDKRYNKVLQVIDDYLVPDDFARKERGEVFTPPDLVRQMLYGVKKDALEAGRTELWGFDGERFVDEPESNRSGGLPKSVWENPNLKWLDPANGIGNFPIIAYYKLDYSLSKVKGYEDADVRRQHIIEKMLYMMELDRGNNETCRGLFKKIFPSAKPNILCCNSLEITQEDMKREFRIDEPKFDIVMGNPPFNPGTIWWKFITKYTPFTKKYMLFIVPSTFTSNVTGENVVEFLKANGLKDVRYLELSDFKHVIDLDTLYFVLEKGYTGEININNVIKINRSLPIINLKNENDGSIFSKLLDYIEKHSHIKLFKGKNETLGHKKPVETANIKFKESDHCNHRMLSRLGGGDHEYYWVHDFVKEEVDSPKIVFPRGTASYNSINNMLNISKDIVYNTCVNRDEVLSNSIMYVPLDSMSQCAAMRWYIMRSKLVRYVFMKVNHLAELTRTIFEYIPLLDVSKLKNDNDIYQILGFSDSEITYIENIFSKVTV
jgi:hypothetical protein